MRRPRKENAPTAATVRGAQDAGWHSHEKLGNLIVGDGVRHDQPAALAEAWRQRARSGNARLDELARLLAKLPNGTALRAFCRVIEQSLQGCHGR